MKKYITTEKHPFGAGIKLKYNESSDMYFMWYDNYLYQINKTTLGKKIYNGLVKEIQEPKWTDEDMIQFAKFIMGSGKMRWDEAIENFSKKL